MREPDATMRDPDEQWTVRAWLIASATGANDVAVVEESRDAGYTHIRGQSADDTTRVGITIERNQLVALADLLRDLAKEPETEQPSPSGEPGTTDRRTHEARTSTHHGRAVEARAGRLTDGDISSEQESKQ